jgi:putative hydrolase of HD superfamily
MLRIHSFFRYNFLNLQNDFRKEIEFILAIDALKNVNRRNFNLDNSRRENTAEHSWQVVVFAQILYPYARNKEK